MGASQTSLPVAVIGAGFSGTMVAIHLCRTLPPERPILLCDRSGVFARGRAYATTNPDHLLNVRASNMSALPERPDHFANWIARCGPEDEGQIRHTPAGTFAARGLYGRYLSELLDEVIVEADDVRHPLALEREAVTDLVPAGVGYRMSLASGRTVAVAGAVLACGNLSVRDRFGSRFAVDPWHIPPLDGLDPDRPLLIVGSGLTMIDAIAAVRARGFSGPILVLSRRGWLPRAHAPAPAWPRPNFTAQESRSVLRLLRRVRAEIAAAAQAGIGWHSVIDSLRPVSVATWHGLPPPERTRFLRHLRACWDVHRHRTAPPAAEMIARELASGTLRILKAKIAAVADADGHAVVTLRERGGIQARRVAVQRIIDASGVASVVDTDDLLLRRLMDRGHVRPDALRLGLDVADDFSVFDRDGRAGAPLWTLGPLLRGTLWECTAVPDIRLQAVALARTIGERLESEPAAAASA